MLDPTCLLQPYFHVRSRGDCFETRGQVSACLGHQIASVRGDRPDGIYAEWKWDGKTLHVRNDRYGFYPLYYFHRDAEFAISSSLITLLALGASPDLDHDAIAVFLRLGHYLGDTTPFRDIRTVPPHASFKWNGDGLQGGGGLTFRPASGLNRQAAIDCYGDLFEQAIRRRASDDEFVVLLSGGRDSRHILLELLRQGHKPKFALTVSYSRSEAEVSAMLAGEAKIRHVVLDEGRHPYLAELQKNMLTGFCAAHDEHAWIMPAVEYLTGDPPLLYDGIGGDVLSAGLFLTPARLALMEKGKFLEVADTLLCPEGAFVQVKEHHKRDREQVRYQVAAELARHAHAPNPIGSFIFWNRTRRHIALAPYGLFHYTTVFSPYLDCDVYDFLAALPASMMIDHTFHSDAIAQRYPDYRHIPYSVRQEGLHRDSWVYRRFALDVLRYCLRSDSPMKVGGMLLQLLRCLAARQDGSSILWLGPLTVYLTQLTGLPSRLGDRPVGLS